MNNAKIEEFLNKKLLTSSNTRKNYTININTYFKLLNKDINTYFNNGYTLEDYNNDLGAVYTVMHDNGRPDLSIRTVFNSVKQFMLSNNKELKELEFWDILKARTKGAEPESDEAILNANDIKEILSHGNACSRALFLMLASSGRRINEILALTPDDIHLEEKPAWINIKKQLKSNTTKTKQKTSRCYISDETVTAYKVWIKERDTYLENSCKRAKKYPKNPEDKRIFPMSYHNALLIWENLLIRAKLVETEEKKDKYSGKMHKQPKRKFKGERLLQHPHCLRKFYRSYLGDADLAEYLMGHSTMLTRAYRQMKPEDLAKKYLIVMENVTIFERTPDLTEINQEINDVKKENIHMKQEIHELRNMISELGNKKLNLLKEIEKKKS